MDIDKLTRRSFIKKTSVLTIGISQLTLFSGLVSAKDDESGYCYINTKAKKGNVSGQERDGFECWMTPNGTIEGICGSTSTCGVITHYEADGTTVNNLESVHVSCSNDSENPSKKWCEILDNDWN